MKIGQVVRFRRKPGTTKEYLGLIIGVDGDFSEVYDPQSKKCYDAHKMDVCDSYEVITIQNKYSEKKK